MSNHLKKLLQLFLIIAFVFTTNSFAQEQNETKIIKVACIGNSITYGSGIMNREKDSYPAVLGRLFGEGYEVKNFGVGGRTLLNNGDKPYCKETAFQEAIMFEPDIVIIKLGTNDSKPQNWKFKDEFEKDYCALIDSVNNISSKPKIYICKPVPAFEIKWGINDSIIVNEIIPVIEKVGKEKEVEIIDLYTPFKEEGKYFPDGIHPNEEGAALMAERIFEAITKKKDN
jgi:lysophospholipase L1-like esterase